MVSDGGKIFSCNQALEVYKALGIKKEQIEKRQAWQNSRETHFNIIRLMADAKFAVATSWEEALSAHRKWMQDYNHQPDFAHEKREDGCHSPAQVIGWHKGTMYPEAVLDRILFATRYTRYLDKHGFLRFFNWKKLLGQIQPSNQVPFCSLFRSRPINKSQRTYEEGTKGRAF
ncbi:MAG: hypothetical protein E6J34_24070 [Chloroflexi bacterium]|nr:MAG: hypothetical protein E6J34_24070 [Chloroflexota bacterium]